MAENSGDAEKSTSFWKTFPGILTAVSTLIGAVTGLILAFNQIGFFKGDSTPTPPPVIVEPPPRASTVEVPSVVNIDQKLAMVLLTKSNLAVGKVTSRSEKGASPGVVLHQRPAARTTVARNTAVDLVVAVQPSPTATVEVPSVVKMDVKDADTILSKHGLRVGTITRQPSKAKPGWVLDQKPAAGIMVERNSAVGLLVAVQPSPTATVKVPGIPKVSQKEAEEILAKHELRVGKITTRLATGMKPGIVIDQRPSAETLVERNTAVDLLVTK